MKKKLHHKKFLKTFFEDRKQVGAIAPSWRFLVSKMCNHIDFEKATCIVEFGPGTGVFTKEILKRANKDCKLIVLELNEEFYELLKNKISDERMLLYKASAETIEEILQEHNIKEVDAVLSSLPLAVIPKDVRRKILVNAKNSLKPNGLYVQYQYSLNAKKLIKEIFSNLNVQFVPINIPPAFIYSANK